MTVTPDRARGAFLGMVLAGEPLHPDAVTLGIQLTDAQLAGALSLAAEFTTRHPGEFFYIQQRGSRTQIHVSPDETGLDDSSAELYFDLDAVSAAILVTVLMAEMD